MASRTVLAAIIMASVGAAASAQEPRFEISGTLGYTFSDGVSGSAEDQRGNEFTRIDPDDSFSWNLRAAFLVNHNAEVGFLFGMQSTGLGISVRAPGAGVPNTFNLGDENVYNYHGYFAYNFGESTKVRPYLLVGLGATQFGGVTVDLDAVPVPHEAQGQRQIDGNTKFSSTWAAGVKFFPGKNVGIRLEGRWTPTYIKSDAEGWWCDPYWGCYTVGDAQYSNQFELGGGIAVRF
jgi:opacity protein-like surface antigen